MDGILPIINLLGFVAPFVPQGGLLGTIASGLVKYGPAINAAVKAGAPVEAAIREHSGELLDAFHTFIDAAKPEGLSKTAARALVLTKVFAPTKMTAEQEQAWFDRASRPDAQGS